ncbi:MAG: cofactor-independent phosphoglycerate mutase [Thermodesulfobacteriota bacterium]|nr:cofactor-independent phosphoglycerate mutase [Thermodesulfobacteriota bacterium]
MKSKIKTVILVGDGMGDLPIPELDGRTPLEAANTPAMDYLSAHGELCRLQTIPDGFPPGSDVANLSLLGYRPEKFYTGRSPLEAASMGVKLRPAEVAFRCNLVTLDFSAPDEVVMVDYSAGHISSDEAKELIQALGDAATEKMCLYPGVSYRHLLVHQGEVPGLTTVPPHDFTEKKVTRFWHDYLSQADLKPFMTQAIDVLADHPVNRKRLAAGKKPANAVWLWGEGKSPQMETLAAQYGISSALISAVDLLKGIGVYAGMDIIEVPGATGYLDTNYQGKVDGALKALETKDLVFVHIEAPDETGHQGLLTKKIQAIEDFDSKIVQPVFDGLRGTDFRLVICMDHFTPISLRTHISTPVPFVLYDSRQINPGSGMSYNEKNAEKTTELLKNGEEFFRKLLKE